MAALVAFLCSAQSSYVTGASFVGDGGMLLMRPMGASSLDTGDWREG
jgi:NAD(P)-dependent dehydrogenase (short-subunit alcohol dehydrogenase family)